MAGKYEKFNKVACVGVGGGGNFYIARFFKLLNCDVEGYDISKTNKTKELEKLGIKVNYDNPSGAFDADAYVYTAALPDSLIEKIQDENQGIDGFEVGEFFNQLVEDFERGNLTQKEKEAFTESNIAPLYNVDFSKMRYIGVTGTDGKTTTATMIYHILKKAGHKPALISTVGARIGDKEVSTGFHVTTPPSQQIYDFIQEIEANDCTHVVLEVTSQGLAMGRLAGAEFDVAVYTNITEEHLDYHDSWEGLFKAKSMLALKHLKSDGLVVLNADDKRTFDKLDPLVENTTVYGWNTDFGLNHANIKAADYISTKNGISFEIEDIDEDRQYKAEIPILGDYNVSNALAAYAACDYLGVSTKQAVSAFKSFETIEGRMEVLQKEPFKVIVDFAHTPNALENALRYAENLVGENGRLISVFGCAGKRDKYKRAKMGAVSARYADITIITAEDPRSERLKDINDSIEEGWEKEIEQKSLSDRKLYRFDDDSINTEVRRNAIKEALDKAEKGDVVIICGKGHENSLCFGTKEYDWNDIHATRALLGDY